MKVAVIGTGYVGLTTAISLAYLGHDVTGVDTDQSKIELLQAGRCPIREPGLEALLRESRSRLAFSMDTSGSVRHADVVFVAVGTPPTTSGEADTRFMEAAVRAMALGMEPRRTYTIVIKSTVPVGSNVRIAALIADTLDQRRVSCTVRVASCPEFLREGTALFDTLYPDRIVVGATSSSAVEVLRSLYMPVLERSFTRPEGIEKPIGKDLPSLVVTDPTSAEMIKYAANAFLAMKISYINEIAGLCEKVGADVVQVANGIGLDTRIGPKFLQPGLGWGGSCLPKDTAALIATGREHGYPMTLVQAARDVNARQRQVAVDKLEALLGRISECTVGVLGLAFKPGTDDVRESPAIDLIRLLLDRGAKVRAHDPVAMNNALEALNGADVQFCTDPYQVGEGADALVLATACDEYHRLDWHRLATKMRNHVLLDARNFCNHIAVRTAGFQYLGVGR